MKKILRKNRKSNIAKRVISMFLVVALVLGVLHLDLIAPDFSKIITPKVHAAAANSRKASLTFNDLNDFVAYSIEYQSNAELYSEDTITLTLNNGEKNTLSENFKSLGTSEWPFNGKIYITATYGDGWYFNTDKPLFDYVTDSVVINYAISEHITEPIPIEIRRKFVDSTSSVALSPLFANHITDGEGTSATWSIKAAPYIDSQDNVNTYNFSGLIGSMDNDAQVNVNFVNDSYYSTQDIHSDIEGASDIGLICGTMNQGSAIGLTLFGTNTFCEIESTTSGNAGGLVGTMHAGSVLTINNSSYVPDSNRVVKATSGYAGGLVGYSDGGLIQFPTPGEGETNVYASIIGTVEGTTAAGGLYGYYSNPVTVSGESQTAQDVTFNMANYDIGCTVKATAAGGLFGVLGSTANITIDGTATGSNEIDITGDTVTNFGGITGKYSASALTNELYVNGVTANTSVTFTGTSYFGGVTGFVEGNNPVYIRVNGLTHNASSGFADATAFGGAVGHAGSHGSMLDIGTLTVVTGSGDNGQAFKGGGVVGVLTDGVLRLSGTTNLSKAPSEAGRDYGQLVGIRKDSLVYAVGTGADSGWTFTRSNSDVQADDIGTWGSVIRADATNLPLATLEMADGTGVLQFDTTAHTVTVAKPVTAMSSGVDYTKTALNMQLNNGDKGALKFAESTNKKTTLLGTNISFSGTINLSGTGNIGLTRDDYKDKESEIGEYTGAISGGTVNLAIGERYGSYTGDDPVGRGTIMAHRYNGLIAKTGSKSVTTTTKNDQDEDVEETTVTSASFSNITIGGNIYVNGREITSYIGGAVAVADNGIILTNVTANEHIYFNGIAAAADNSSYLIGGMVGNVASTSTNNISITGCSASSNISITGTLASSEDDKMRHSIGGVIGRISATAAFDIDISSTTIGVIISNPSVTNGAVAGLIADIVTGSNTRTMNLTGVTVSGTSITNGASSHAGGLLGHRWLKTDVNFTSKNGVIVSGTNTLTTGASYSAGLVQRATGHWTVPEKGIGITGMTLSGMSNSLGIIVHDGYYSTDGLYLELTHKDSYNLQSGLTIPSTTTYDELVATTGSDILSNRSNGIISITTNGDLIMTGSSCNTYQNVYNHDKLTNNKSRYYYNLTSICADDSKSDGEKLLLWSLNQYAATNIKDNFPASLTTTSVSPLAGTFDLEHISYYPIDMSDSIFIGNATFTFYNDKIENGETQTGNTDTSNSATGLRTTRGASQHFLMHSGLFRNVSGSIETKGDIHFKGAVGVGTTGTGTSQVVYSGAFINGTISGSLKASDTNEIVLEGITISDPSKYLLINKLTTNSKMALSGVRTGGGKDFSNTDKTTETKYNAGATVASSLIGDVSGNGVQIEFTRMKLDSRSTADSPADWSAQYGTTKSIFSGATFLNTFAVDNNSTGTYNFDEDLDWVSGTHNANVTYGKEIKTSVEYSGKQEKYFDQTNYVDPVTAPSASRTSVYPFDSGFLPYVKVSTADGTSTTRELKVNVSVEGLVEGCGTYNHPYEITSGTQLVNVATAINKTGYPDNLRLPKINGENYATAISTHWCNTKNTSCAEFEHGSENYTYKEGNTTYTWTEDQVSLYLASAYYLIKNDISITGAFPGLGGSPANDTTGKYAFRGVIIGAKSDGTTKISMSVPKTKQIDKYENTHGLITMSNGCVVKNLTIEVTPYASDLYNYWINGNQAYGYDEKFSNYGAVINKIMGGDNIIDNVSVNLIGIFKVRNDSDYKATVGGYVGCVVNGGLIFRNVEDSNLTTTTVTTVNGVETTTKDQGFKVIKVNDKGAVQSVTCNGKTITSLTDEDDLIHIHVNPFVGRVINGYAIRESDSYAFSEDGATYGDGETRANAVEVTMHNTRKNYSIPDINTSMNFQDDPDSVLTFTKETGETTYNTITVPNSQALFIMSIIAQSGSGCASSEYTTGNKSNYTYNISYCGNSDNRAYAGTTQDNNKTTHKASYSNVGTATSTSDSDYSLSILDEVGGKTAVPYIIYKYTSSFEDSGTKYPARTLTQRTFYVNLVDATYYLPDSFRGIGFLGSTEYVNDNMKIYGFNGNGAIIDLNAEYFSHQRTDDPYTNAVIGNYYGLGLFNSLQQIAQTTTNDTTKRRYVNDVKYQITNFTMQGYISAHNVNNSNGTDQYNSANDNKYLITGGFVPVVCNSNFYLFNFSNISFEDFHVSGHSHTGGFIGHVTDACSLKIYINNCNADGYIIEGSGRVGGFIGSYDTSAYYGGIHINTGLDSSNNDSFSCAFTNTIVNNKYANNDKWNYTAGVIGCVYLKTVNNAVLTTDYGDNAYGTLVLRNVTIEGGDPESNYIGNKQTPTGSAGGILGGATAQCGGCLIIDCTVKNIDIYGRYSGGIFGEAANRNSSKCETGAKIIGCTVTGDLDENDAPQYTIMALQYAGGIYGDTRDINGYIPKYKSNVAGDDEAVGYSADIDGVYVYGYNILSINQNNLDAAETNTATSNAQTVTGYAAGGITGNNDNNRTIQNCKVEKCIIDVGTNADSATNTPCAGLIGRMNSGILYGYNIEVKDCEFLTHQWVGATTSNGVTTTPAHAINTQKAYIYTDEDGEVHNPISGMMCGNFIGNGNSKTVNLTAVHSENCPASTDFNGVASASFMVYADYLDAASSDDHGTSMSTLRSLSHSVTKNGTTTTTEYTEAGEGGLSEYFPHVNVSPVISMGDAAFLTGDGAGVYAKSGKDTPIVDAIISGGKYSTSGSTVTDYITAALSANEDANRISTYYTEMGSLPEGVDDFAVVVINTENKVNSTDIINNYIRMVTNTSASYIADSSNKYVINVYPCTYDEDASNYVINASGKTAGLYYSVDSSQYYMQNGYADSNQGDYQFSLIDVQYLNPDTTNHPNEVVYHLYVPVLTRKMMMFGFKSASLSGTDIILDNFENYGNTLAESLKSWYTGYVHFTYPISELQNLLDNGTGLNWNSSKTLQLKYTTNDVSSKLSGDTQLVLVDPYGSDKYYYSELSTLRPATDTNGSVDNISLSDFNSKLDGSGNGFTPTTIAGLMTAQGFTVTAQTGTANAAGYYYKVTTDSTKASITIGETMYEFVGENNSGNVKLTIVAPEDAEMTTGDDPEALLKEDYYLCVRADGNRVYNYSIRTPATIAGGSGAPSLRVSNLKENEITNIIMGDLYQQSVTIGVSNNGTNNLVIDSTNHQLDVSLRTIITLSGTSDDKDFILNHLSSGNINLYQAFVLTLTAQDSTGKRVDILGEPNVTATYTINGSPASPANSSQPEVTGDNILLLHHDIKNYLSKTGSTAIAATVHIDFDEAWKYNQEFPSQDGSDPSIGVNVSTTSNLAYNTDSLLYTNMTAYPAAPNTNYYYVKESEEAGLVFNFKSGILDEFDEAGFSSFNYSQQGVNPKNFIDSTDTRIPMETVATYNASNVKQSEFATAKKVKYTLKLYKKTGEDGNAVYTEVTDVAKYIDLTPDNSVFIKVNSGVTTAYASGGKMTKSGNNELTYTADINQNVFSRQEDQMFDADIDFTVITGEGFKEYANYRFVLTVDLLDKNDNPININSSAHDWVVYTNAKINPNMLSVTESGGN